MNLPFTIILPGLAPITEFLFDNSIYHVDIASPHLVHSICLTLTC